MGLRVSDLQSVDEPAVGDLLSMIDVSDTSMAPTGTNKKFTFGLLQSYQPTTSVSTSGTISETVYSPYEIVTAPGVTRTLPSARVGWEGYLMSDVHATVKLALPTNWRFEYSQDVDGRPVVSKRGGVIRYVVTAPGVYTLYGDYSIAKYGWHPSDETSALIGVWQAGYGHNYTAIGNLTEAVAVNNNTSPVWGARWGNGAIMTHSADYSVDLWSYGPKLVNDPAFLNGKAYVMRTGTAERKLWKSSQVPSGAFTIYLGCRQSGVGYGPEEVLRMGTRTKDTAFPAGKEGLYYINDTYGYQFLDQKTIVAYGSKPTGTVLEHVTSPIMLSLEMASNGGSTCYVGNTLVTSKTSSGAFTGTICEFVGGLLLHINGIAMMSGVPATATDRTQRQNFFTNLFLQ